MAETQQKAFSKTGDVGVMQHESRGVKHGVVYDDDNWYPLCDVAEADPIGGNDDLLPADAKITCVKCKRVVAKLNKLV